MVDDGYGNGRGLRNQAGIVVGMPFGLTSDTGNDGIFGSRPWSGRTPDPDQADIVVESLEDTIAAMSGIGRSGREFEDRMVATNSPGTPKHVDDHMDPRLDAGKFFNGLMYRIRSGPMTGTRLGAHVVTREDAAGAASDAAGGGWTRGGFAYAPNDAPSVGGIPDWGRAAFRGSAVAAAPVNAREQEGATLCAGRIELVAGFTWMGVKDAIVEMKDESGRTWWAMSSGDCEGPWIPSRFRPPAFPLPPPKRGSARRRRCDGCVRGRPNRRQGRTRGVQCLLHRRCWRRARRLGAFDIEGALGPMRTGGVAGPRLPGVVDGEGGAARGSMHWTTESTPGFGTGGLITAPSRPAVRLSAPTQHSCNSRSFG